MLTATPEASQAMMDTFMQRPLVRLRGMLTDLRLDLEADASLERYTQAILECGLLEDLPATEKGKCSRTAAAIRAEGNRKFKGLDYDGALLKYNESICHAETNSADLGIGYANRSAVYFAQNEFELALANIAMAKQHHYPEPLMEKLLDREQKCQAKLAEGLSKGTVPKRRFDLNVPVNPKIPFLAEGISMVRLEDFGRSMVATKNFAPGDVILHEKSILASIDLMKTYKCCNLCSAEASYNLIPCPNCVTVMYCSRECLERDSRLVHRFECPIAEKVRHLCYGFTNLGTKLFFYGLSLFKDDLDEMMRYCERVKTGGNPLNLDYTRYDPLEEFKELYNVNATTNPANEGNYRFFVAIRCLMFLQCPLIKSIVRTKQHKSFMRQCVLDFTRAGSYYRYDVISPVFPVQSLFNHSCDPNILISTLSGHVKLVVIRPIRPNEQICFSYGFIWWEPESVPMSQQSVQGVFNCKCVVCDPMKKISWLANSGHFTAGANRALGKLMQAVRKPFSDDLTELQVLESFIQKYGAIAHPQKDFGLILTLYWRWLYKLLREEDAALRRAKIVAELGGQSISDVD